MSDTPQKATGGEVHNPSIIGEHHTHIVPLPEESAPPPASDKPTFSVTINVNDEQAGRAAADPFQKRLNELMKKD